MLEKQMRVEEVLGREVTIRWFEGVALVQAICRQLAARDGRQDVFPTAAEIVLAADGTVSAVHPSGHTAVRTAAQLLARMLGEDVPVRLRLIVAQATGADTAYPTLEEFSTALAYFERPDSTEVLRALFERAVVAPVRAVTPEQTSAPLLAPDEEQERSRTRTHLRLVVGAAVTAVCVIAAWLGASAVDYSRLGVAFSSLTSGASGPTRAPSPPRPKASAVGTGGSGSEARRDAERASERSSKAVARTSAGPAAERTNARATAARPTARRESLSVAALLPLNPMRPSPITSAAEYRPVFAETVEIRASEAGPENGVDADGARIYSRADADVVPPRSVYPKLPSDPPGEPDNRTILELVIGTNGLVERARLRSIPRDIHEFMLVSAAKAWIFEPATVEGMPVRYRHRVLISLP